MKKYLAFSDKHPFDPNSEAKKGSHVQTIKHFFPFPRFYVGNKNTFFVGKTLSATPSKEEEEGGD